MIKSLRPHQLVRPLHQHFAKTVAYSTQAFFRSHSSIETEPGQSYSKRELLSVPTFSYSNPYSNPHYVRTFSGKTASMATEIRAAYDTKTNVAGEPIIHDIFERKTGTWQYVVADPITLSAVIIDPVLDFDPVSQIITTNAADSLLSVIKERGYKVERILETHAHADHLTAAFYLQNRLSQEQGQTPPVGIGKRIQQVQTLFGQKYGVPAEEYEGVFNVLFDDDETFDIGELQAKVIHLPGHTPDHLGYKIGDNVFCGDSIFHPDIGTARCDFPGGSANNLFSSAQKLLSLADNVKIWTGHDYPPEERGIPVAWTYVRDHRKQNKHLKDGIAEDEFVALRKERDALLGEPRLLHQSLQINIRAGRLPKPTESNTRMLSLPLKLKNVENSMI